MTRSRCRKIAGTNDHASPHGMEGHLALASVVDDPNRSYDGYARLCGLLSVEFFLNPHSHYSILCRSGGPGREYFHCPRECSTRGHGNPKRAPFQPDDRVPTHGGVPKCEPGIRAEHKEAMG